METQHEQHIKESKRTRAIVAVLIGFVAPLAVLMLSGPAETSVRAFYALCLCGLMAGGGVWIVFHAGPEQLAKRWTPQGLKPAWAVFMRLCGLFVIVAAGVLLTSTVQDVVELVSSRHPRTFVEEARGVEGKIFLHYVFQSVWLRGDGRYRTVYMFAYGGKRLIDGKRYVIAVLPRSHWILSAREEIETARP